MAKEPTNEIQEIELELKRLELEEKKILIESKKTQDELARMQLSTLKSELEMKRGNKERGHRDAMKAIADQKEVQARCNHHTGGDGSFAISQGQGDVERPTCIGAQQFLDDRIRLTCQRCRAECFSDDPDRQKWAYWVNLWRRSVNKQMMIVGGLKQVKQQQIVA